MFATLRARYERTAAWLLADADQWGLGHAWAWSRTKAKLWLTYVAQARYRRAIARARADENAKCPACGYRLGRIEFSPAHRLLVHTCLKCRASWGELPLVSADVWLAKQPAMPEGL